MPQQCCVYKCNSLRVKGTFMQSFHRFPRREKSPTRFKLWERKISRKGFEPTKHSVVCSKHFDVNDFEESCLLKLKLITTQKFKGLLKKSAYPKLYLKGETEERKPNSSLISSYQRNKIVQEAIASKGQDFQEMISEEIDIKWTVTVPDPDDGGTKITNKIEEMDSIKSETVWSHKNSSVEFQANGEYEPEYVWVKQEVLVKEEVEDAVPEETDEEQPSHLECYPYTEEELETTLCSIS